MKKTGWLLIGLMLMSGVACARPRPPFMGQNFSGEYACTGDDAHEGPYNGTVTLKLMPEQSTAEYSAYSFKLQVPKYGTYVGEAAAIGNNIAMHFALTDPAPRDFGTGVAIMEKNKQGKWSFHKYYYEPEFKGGNYGFENCVMK
ncbi:MAG TPA: hypothetical protein VIE17_00670 [Methylophilaceae bacterium]